MAEQAPPLDATFNAFKKREKRFVLTRAAIGYCLAVLVFTAAYFAVTWVFWRDVLAWYLDVIGSVSTGSEPTAPDPVMFAPLAPVIAVSALISLILLAAFEAACLRWLTRGESGGGFLGLRLGADTWRVFAIYWLWLLLLILFIVAVVAFYVALRAATQAAPVLQIPLLLVAALAPLGFIALTIWIGVRLAPAAALSVAHRRFTFFGAWAATRGYFWPLLGAFVILIVGYSVIAIIVQQIVSLPFAAPYAQLLREMMAGDASPETLFARAQDLFVTPTLIAVGVIYLIASETLSCMLYIAFFGANARIAEVTKSEAAPAQP